jgi:hypothetical protein
VGFRRSTQPLNMSTRNSPGGEGGRCVELTTNHPSSAERQEIRGLNLPGPPRAPGGLLREYLYLKMNFVISSLTVGNFKSVCKTLLDTRAVKKFPEMWYSTVIVGHRTTLT